MTLCHCCHAQDLRRNQKRIAELNATIRKLEDRNTLLVDERNELVREPLHWQAEESRAMGKGKEGEDPRIKLMMNILVHPSGPSLRRLRRTFCPRIKNNLTEVT